MTGRNLHRVIGVSFGLLCVLQAALNICLRLIIYSEAPNGTAEERNKFDKLDPYFQQGWFHFQKSLYYISSVKNTWHLSREYCLQEGADLAIINSRAEQVVTGYWSLVNSGKANREVEMTLLQTSYNMTKERDQIQTSYTHAIAEKYQLRDNLTKQTGKLQTSYNNLMKEKEQLQTSYNNLITERDQLQKRNNKLTKDNDHLQTSYNHLNTSQTVRQGFESSQVFPPAQFLPRALEPQVKAGVYLGGQKTWLDESPCRTGPKTPDAEEQFMHLRFVFLFPCPAGKGWVYFSGSLYQVSSTKKTWDQSRSDCRQKGADLLIINSEEEQAFANRFQKYMWIGLTDVTNEGSWKWVDGTAMSTSYWSSKEPNGGKGEKLC
ncbi:C-type lectin domain family 4 member M-like [Takifugu rubripes]|uniref:C-type lectin domain family 4 member M-like n=1 Tax=Takifugu rubripes TaxID=31033 RepID=UPI0011455C93|nr:C-type lectin domain family 4 member M-like [Takifugu rubripes]